MQPDPQQELELQKKLKKLSEQNQPPQLRPIEKLNPQDLRSSGERHRRQFSVPQLLVLLTIVSLAVMGIVFL